MKMVIIKAHRVDTTVRDPATKLIRYIKPIESCSTDIITFHICPSVLLITNSPNIREI